MMRSEQETSKANRGRLTMDERIIKNITAILEIVEKLTASLETIRKNVINNTQMIGLTNQRIDLLEDVIQKYLERRNDTN